MPVNKQKLYFYAIKYTLLPVSWLPLKWIQKLGIFLGSILYYFLRQYRKRALSNLSLASELHFSNEDIKFYAKKSFQNLAINCLELVKFSHMDSLSSWVKCENPEVADKIYKTGKGIIFFCAHQSNWEVLFLDATPRMKGIAIGKPIKNKYLYEWLVSIREKFGGKIVSPYNAISQGFKALKKGMFIGIVGDQGMPDSGYSYPFFGRKAWTSTAPALLAYRTQSPIIFASTKRGNEGYKIHYSDPIYPDHNCDMDQDVIRMMDQLLDLLQKSIKESPGEWLWQHNRWKQQNQANLYKRFRQDCILLILPDETIAFEELLPHLKTLRTIYKPVFITALIHKKFQNTQIIDVEEKLYYETIDDVLLNDYRFKLVFNFSRFNVEKHFEKFSVLETLNIKKLTKLAKEHLTSNYTLSDIFRRALCRPGTVEFLNKELPKQEPNHAL